MKVTGCNRCYQVEVTGRAALFAFGGVWKEIRGERSRKVGPEGDGQRAEVFVGGRERKRGLEEKQERKGGQRARVRDRRSQVAVDMKHPSMKQAPSLRPSSPSPPSHLSSFQPSVSFSVPSLSPLPPAHAHSPSNASTFSLPCTYLP